MIYFDNAATSFPKPDTVRDAVCRAIDSFANPSRGSHELSLNALRCVEYTRTQVARLFGCPDSQRIAFTSNVTEALNIAIRSIRGHIVTTEAEHNSVLRPVFRSKNFTVAKVDRLGRYSAEDIARALRPDTKAVVVGHASNVTGTIAPVAAIGRLCRERGIVFIVDAAQTAGLLDIDMVESNIDALCFTGHKSLYGLQGTGGLCLGARFTPDPLVVGGSGSHSFDPEQPTEMPTRLEAGTLNSHGIAALSAGIHYVNEMGTERLLATASKLARRFYNEVAGLDGITFLGDCEADARMPIVTLNVGSLPSSDVADILAEEYDIAVRAGAHCAPLLHKAFGTVEFGAVRFSFSHFNTIDEVTLAIESIRRLSAKEW